jgi:hypothetical protein
MDYIHALEGLGETCQENFLSMQSGDVSATTATD